MSQMPTTDHRGQARYEIRVQGHLEARRAAWFDGLTLIPDSDGTTVLRGPLMDQAALHGVLQKLRDLGIPLISVTDLGPKHPEQLGSIPDPQTPPHTSSADWRTTPQGD